MKKNFINLSNGIEALKRESLDLDNVHFIRIQSSHCEAHQFDRILYELDSNFLMSLALGYDCYVYDYGAGAPVSKAIYTGLEWIRYILNRRWFGYEVEPVIKNKNVGKFFDEKYRDLEKRTKKKIDYYRNFLAADKIRLTGISGYASLDNKPKELFRILIDSLEK